MPELPEVEAICRTISPEITGRTIKAVHVVRALATRPQAPAAVVRLATGRRIRSVRRRGKNIVIDLSGGLAIRIHLRMTGHLHVDGEVSPSTRVWFELGRSRALLFDDTRALGRLAVHTAAEVDRLLAPLGPEPLSPEFTPRRLVEEARRSRQPAKLFLMDQKHVAGLGNIYAAEALFRARINPVRPANSLSRAKLAALHGAILSVLQEAVKSAKIAYKYPGNRQETEEFVPAVYGRGGEPCVVCGRAIRRMEQGGRSTYYCPKCQK
jgi:formamidopyrimidine-DNA glycosylase